jgi:hypothetical protein
MLERNAGEQICGEKNKYFPDDKMVIIFVVRTSLAMFRTRQVASRSWG